MGQSHSTPDSLIRTLEMDVKKGNLNLSGFQLTTVPQRVYEQSTVVSIDLSRNLITKIHSKLYYLPQLKFLDLSFNALSCLPFVMGSMTLLTELRLQHNNLKSLPEELCLLKHLVELNCSHNDLVRLPERMGNLVELKKFDCCANKLQVLPISLCSLRNLEVLICHENPFIDLPKTVIDGGVYEIFMYMNQLEMDGKTPKPILPEALLKELNEQERTSTPPASPSVAKTSFPVPAVEKLPRSNSSDSVLSDKSAVTSLAGRHSPKPNQRVSKEHKKALEMAATLGGSLDQDIVLDRKDFPADAFEAPKVEAKSSFVPLILTKEIPPPHRGPVSPRTATASPSRTGSTVKPARTESVTSPISSPSGPPKSAMSSRSGSASKIVTVGADVKVIPVIPSREQSLEPGLESQEMSALPVEMHNDYGSGSDEEDAGTESELIKPKKINRKHTMPQLPVGGVVMKRTGAMDEHGNLKLKELKEDQDADSAEVPEWKKEFESKQQRNSVRKLTAGDNAEMGLSDPPIPPPPPVVLEEEDESEELQAPPPPPPPAPPVEEPTTPGEETFPANNEAPPAPPVDGKKSSLTPTGITQKGAKELAKEAKEREKIEKAKAKEAKKAEKEAKKAAKKK